MSVTRFKKGLLRMNDDEWLVGIWGTIDDFPDCGIREPGNLFMNNFGGQRVMEERNYMRIVFYSIFDGLVFMYNEDPAICAVRRETLFLKLLT